MQVSQSQLSLQASYQRVKVEGRYERTVNGAAAERTTPNNPEAGAAASLPNGRQPAEASANPRALAVAADPAPPAWGRRESEPTPATNASSGSGAVASSELGDGDLSVRIVRLILEAMLGRGLALGSGVDGDADAEAPPAVGQPPAVSAGEAVPAAPPTATQPQVTEVMEFSYEAERSQFMAEGAVTLSDGRAFSFSLELTMAREELKFSYSRTTLGAVKDPLALNLGLKPLTATGRTAFDLDGDGQANEQLASLSGAAWLARDVNGDGKVNNGSELFGPQSGDGFAELAALDEDGNGVIDSGDSAFSSLRLWHSDSGQLQSLKEAGIAALFVDSVATPFSLKVADDTVAVVRNSGVYLRDNGVAGALQQIDVVT